MEIIKKILSILKKINFRYEKNENNHSLNINMNDELKGSIHVDMDDSGKRNISAKLGE